MCQNRTRTRQHSPAPERNELLDLNNPLSKAMWANASEVHDTQVARTATLAENKRVLDILHKWICVQYELTRVIDVLDVRDKIESLRQQAGDSK